MDDEIGLCADAKTRAHMTSCAGRGSQRRIRGKAQTYFAVARASAILTDCVREMVPRGGIEPPGFALRATPRQDFARRVFWDVVVLS